MARVPNGPKRSDWATSGSVQEPVLQGVAREIRVPLNAHLGENAAAVRGHALDGHAQCLCDLAGPLAARQPVEHLKLTDREPLVRAYFPCDPKTLCGR